MRREGDKGHTHISLQKERGLFPFFSSIPSFFSFPLFRSNHPCNQTKSLISLFLWWKSLEPHLCICMQYPCVHMHTQHTHNFGILQRQSSRPLQRKGGKNPPKEEIEDSESKWKIFSKDKGEKICMNGWLRKALTDCLFLMSGRWVVNGLSFYILMAFPSYSAR